MVHNLAYIERFEMKDLIGIPEIALNADHSYRCPTCVEMFPSSIIKVKGYGKNLLKQCLYISFLCSGFTVPNHVRRGPPFTSYFFSIHHFFINFTSLIRWVLLRE